MSLINAHLDCWIKFHVLIWLIVIFVTVAHSCSDFSFIFRSSNVCTPQYPLRRFDSDVKLNDQSSLFDRQTILLGSNHLVTLFHQLRETDEIVVTFGNDIDIS